VWSRAGQNQGYYAVVTGGANTLPDPAPSGTVFVVDLHANKQVATVTGVGIDPYNVVVVEDLDE
jgi:YVTN family beta-propeller protein